MCFLLRPVPTLIVASLLALLIPPLPALHAAPEKIPPDTLPEELRVLDVKEQHIPADYPEVGTLHALNGRVVVVHRAVRQAYFGSPGDRIYENDELHTLEGARCRIGFFTDDVVNMAPNTRFAVDSFEDRPRQGEKTSLFTMLKGKAMFYALRLFRYKEIRFRVKTPTAVVGVRGTKFGMEIVGPAEDRADQRPLVVADRGRDIGPFLAQAQEAPNPALGTIVACGDGSLIITDPSTGRLMARVNPNEHYNTFTGQKTFDPENRTLERISTETEVQEDTDENADVEEAPAETGEDAAAVDEEILQDESTVGGTVDATEIAADVTAQELGEEIQETQEPERDYPIRHYGYFNGFLKADIGSGAFYLLFDRTDLDGTGTATGRRFGTTVGSMTFDGAGAVGIKAVTALTHDGKTVDSGLPADVQWTEYGHNAWMVWGMWRQPLPMHTSDLGGDTFYFDHRGYLFAGDYTTDSQMAALQGSLGVVTYTGEAWGKYRDAPAGEGMTGGFTAKVNFTTPSIDDFDMTVSGGGHSVSILDAKGGFTGSSSNFIMDKDTGSWTIDGNPGVYKDARGSLYGDKAQGFGANWVVGDGTETAWGMCVGER